MIFTFFSEKKSTFSHSTKNIKSRWVFIVQIWFTNPNEAKSTRKKVGIIFHKHSYRKKWNLFFSTIIRLQVHIKKRPCWKWKIQSWVLLLILSALFRYTRHLCSIKTECALFFLINLFLQKTKSWEKRPQSFDKENLRLPIMHAWPRF